MLRFPKSESTYTSDLKFEQQNDMVRPDTRTISIKTIFVLLMICFGTLSCSKQKEDKQFQQREVVSKLFTARTAENILQQKARGNSSDAVTNFAYVSRRKITAVTEMGDVLVWDTEKETLVMQDTLGVSENERIDSVVFSAPRIDTNSEKKGKFGSKYYAVLFRKERDERWTKSTVKLFKNGTTDPVWTKTDTVNRRIHQLGFSNKGGDLWIFGKKLHRIDTSTFDRTGTSEKRILYDNPTEADVAPNGKWVTLATWNVDGETVVRWNVNNGLELEDEVPFVGHMRTTYEVDFSPDSETLAVGSKKDDHAGWLKIFDVSEIADDYEEGDGGLKKELQDQTGGVIALKYSPSGDKLATSNANGTIKVRNVNSGETIGKVEIPVKEKPLRGNPIKLAFAPDEKSLIFSYLGSIYRWDYGE